MSWWLHRVGEIVVRIVLPISGLLVAVLLLVYSFGRQMSPEDTWTIRLLGGGVAIMSIVLLIVMNTRRARQRWNIYVIPDEPSAGPDDDT